MTDRWRELGDPIRLVSQPPRERDFDAVSVAQQTDVMMLGNIELTPKFAFANIAGATTDGAVVAAVSGHKIRVLSGRLSAITAQSATFTSKPAGAGTAITELIAFDGEGPFFVGFSPVGHFETASGEGLSLTTAAGPAVGVGVVYVEVPA